MTRYTVTLPGEPAPKRRPRVSRRGTYTPEQTVIAEEAIGWGLKAAGCRPLDGPVRVEIRAYCRRLDTDVDNIAKLVLDACNGIAWQDDRQVAELHVWVERRAERPRTELVIEQIADGVADQPVSAIKTTGGAITC